MTDGEWLDTLFRRPHFQDINKSKPHSKSRCTHTYSTNSYQKAKAKQLKAWCHVSVTPGFGRQKGRKIPGSKPAYATQTVKQNKLKQTKDTHKSHSSNCFSLCVWTTNVGRDHYRQMLRAQAALCCPWQHTLTHPSSQRLKQTLWEWFDGGYHSKQKAIPDSITKCGPVIRVLLHGPW